MERYCKATLNVSFNKKISIINKNCLYDRFFVLNRNFITLHIKIVQNSRIFSDFCLKFEVFFSQIPDVFSLNCQIPGFPEFLVFGNPVNNTRFKFNNILKTHCFNADSFQLRSIEIISASC